MSTTTDIDAMQPHLYSQSQSQSPSLSHPQHQHPQLLKHPSRRNQAKIAIDLLSDSLSDCSDMGELDEHGFDENDSVGMDSKSAMVGSGAVYSSLETTPFRSRVSQWAQQSSGLASFWRPPSPSKAILSPSSLVSPSRIPSLRNNQQSKHPSTNK